ncbi:MAG: hypothetical protein C4526_05780 [Nitrospiraceae bacterium]|nr:MAG: hypothetical protein C4526_05780 [Nitrospiraceae bacterium]
MTNTERIDDEINIFDYIHVLKKRKMLILLIVAVSVASTGIVSFLLPPVYGSEAVAMTAAPQQEQRDINTVSIEGYVKKPGKYAMQKGEKLSSLVVRAGGYSAGAFPGGAVFTRERVRESQQKYLDEMISWLEEQLLPKQSAGSVFQKRTADAGKAETEHKKNFMEKLKKLRATGRLSIRLAHPRLLKGTEYDTELEEGDYLFVPPQNNTVDVTGAVISGGRFAYSGKLSYRDYIEAAGGYAEYADKGRAYVLKADGEARNLFGGLINWNASRLRWEVIAFGEKINEIGPGDIIVVPENYKRVEWLKEVQTITDMLMQIAVITGLTVELF